MTEQAVVNLRKPKTVKVSGSSIPELDTTKVVDVGAARLILGDVLGVLKSFENESFDLAIVDPPYGASSKSDWRLSANHKLPGFGGEWNLASNAWDQLSGVPYLVWSAQWLAELKRIVRPTGSIWLHGTYHNSGFLNVACQSLGLEIINEVVWIKRNSFPNLSGRRLTASHESLLWVHTGVGRKRLYRFNYLEAKAYPGEADSFKKAGFQMRTAWDIPNNKTQEELVYGSHPTQKPLRLLGRILTVSGLRGGSLLVPFSGSGSAMVAGIRAGMRPTGIEADPAYFHKAARWLEHAQRSDRQMRLPLETQ
jgi:site-specific DNA-methyltransferase (adenine-specific)